MEEILLVINNVQAKSMSSIIIKTCDLIFTSDRIICIPVGSSTLVSSMMGGAIAGSSGSIAFGQATINSTIKQSKHNSSKSINDLLKIKDSYFIYFNDLNSNKSIFKTGFFSTLGLWAPLTIYNNSNKRFFFNIPYKSAKKVKTILSSITTTINLK